MTKIKQKSKRASFKRFKVTGTGKLKYRHSNRGHCATFRTTKQKRHAKKNGILSKPAMKILKGQIKF
ncbi:MAG: 50S ribosomal protein L35 [Mycoplasmataceae bacterium]|jgi:large subunit ribosomal protein L35|nr:50S ribosomal protein L35 [Mycoplasmataceae bacterium]